MRSAKMGACRFGTAVVSVGALVAMLTSVPLAVAAFTGNVCSLVSAGKLASVHVNETCVALKPLSSPSGTIARATWGSLLHPGKNGSLGINVTSVSPSIYSEILATDKARPHTSVGIGQWSMTNGLVNGKKGAIVEFVLDDDLVVITVNAGKPLANIGPVVALAKTVSEGI